MHTHTRTHTHIYTHTHTHTHTHILLHLHKIGFSHTFIMRLKSCMVENSNNFEEVVSFKVKIHKIVG